MSLFPPFENAVSSPLGFWGFGSLPDLTNAVLQAQQMQLEIMSTWQRSLFNVQQEMWDEWRSRWGGGAPLGD
ncbi:MAG TPA: hypothetical protein VFY73_13725 [Ideonella sp.]|uniref:hypothetical protein n=1 Tax=Ideonella sp. TaxID=1929293 RepID=UPI002E337019|nr:hypothetical protein [Ideonella sp.]HEX5685076.1 hypothetical protein [Ideonella sp.]